MTVWANLAILKFSWYLLGDIVSDQLSLNFFVAITFLALIAKDLEKLRHLVILLSATCSLIFILNT